MSRHPLKWTFGAARRLADSGLATVVAASLVAWLVVMSTSGASGLIFLPKFTTRFCYNSPNLTVTSQCVYCSYFQWDSTVLSCTGSSAVNVNMTSLQAFCIIAQCLSQVKQTPIFLGRKRREAETLEFQATEVTEGPELSLSTESIEFTFNGRPEKYIIAKKVDVIIEPEPDDEVSGVEGDVSPRQEEGDNG